MASSKGIIDKLKDAAASVGDFFKSDAPAGKTAARKAAVVKPAPAKKAPAKKAPAKKPPAKKSPAKKSAAKKSSGGRAQDRAKVAASQPHEVRYEARKMGVSTAAVKTAVKAVGNSRKKVEAELKK